MSDIERERFEEALDGEIGVPDEPTEEMLEACLFSKESKDFPANAKRYLKRVYKTMMANAPQQSERTPDAYVIFDANGQTPYSTAVDKDPELPLGQRIDYAWQCCNEHIQECIEQGVGEAAQWVIRPVVISNPPGNLTDGTDIDDGSSRGWISVDDELPDADLQVLVSAPQVDDYELDYVDVCAQTGDEWFANDPGRHITHWMRIPNPPQSRSQIMSERISLQGFLELLVIAESATAIKLIEQFQRGGLVVEDKIVNQAGSVEDV